MNYSLIPTFFLKSLLLGAFLLSPVTLKSMDKVLPTYDPVRFAANASRFGNKGAHLYELRIIVDVLNTEVGAEIFAVPAFYTIDHDEIIAYLKDIQYQGLSVYDYLWQQWRGFVAAQKHYDGTTVAPDARDFLRNWQEALTHAARIARFGEKNPAFAAFLKDARGKLIVRSSGKSEDSKTVSLAGAFESFGTIDPEPAAVTYAISLVLVSYFNENACEQRLAAGDQELFQEPFLAVVVQNMVGTTGIPIGGVIFTEEAEGRTPGIADIRCVWGLNKGFVDGLVPHDAYFVGPRLQGTLPIYPVIGRKTSRVSADAVGSTIVIPNDAELQTRACLTPQVMSLLKRCAEVVEAYYGCPQDIEFVISDERINLVQTRPITYDTSIAPSYIKGDILDSAQVRMPVTMISAAGGSVRLVLDNRDILVGDRMRTVFDEYLKRNDKGRIQAVVLGEKAASTSHAGTVWRSAGKPIAYTLQSPAVLRQFDSVHFPLLFDTQRGIFISHSDPVSAILSGWTSYPLPKKISLLPDNHEEVSREFFTRWKEYFPGVPTSQLFEKMKPEVDGAIEIPQRAVCSVMVRLMGTVRRSLRAHQVRVAQKEQTMHDFPQQLLEVYRAITSTAQRLMNQLEQWERSGKSETERLSCLYHCSFLEAFISQVPSSDTIHDYSFCSLLRDAQEEARLVDKHNLQSQPARAFLVQYARFGSLAITDSIATAWKEFITELSKVQDENTHATFAVLVRDLGALGLLSKWLNLCFPRAVEKAASARNAAPIVRLLTAQYESNASFIKELQELKKKMACFDSSCFEDPEVFKKQWVRFQDQYLSFFRSTRFARSFVNASNELGHIASLEVMRQFVTLFDLSIKALKRGELRYRNIQDLAERFRMMILSFLEILAFWYDDLHPKILVPEDSSHAYFSTLYRYLSSQEPTAAQLIPNPRFSVSRYALGAARGTRQNRLSEGESPTWENVFSLIHRGLMGILGALSVEVGIERGIPCPEYARALKKALDTHDCPGFERRSYLVGIDLEDDEIRYLYDWPIVNHGITFVLTVNTRKRTSRLSVEISFFAEKAARGGLEMATAKLQLAQEPYMTFTEMPHVDSEGTYHHEVVFSALDANIEPYIQRYMKLIEYISENPLITGEQFVTFFLRQAAPAFVEKRLAILSRPASAILLTDPHVRSFLEAKRADTHHEQSGDRAEELAYWEIRKQLLGKEVPENDGEEESAIMQAIAHDTREFRTNSRHLFEMVMNGNKRCLNFAYQIGSRMVKSPVALFRSASLRILEEIAAKGVECTAIAQILSEEIQSGNALLLQRFCQLYGKDDEYVPKIYTMLLSVLYANDPRELAKRGLTGIRGNGETHLPAGTCITLLVSLMEKIPAAREEALDALEHMYKNDLLAGRNHRDFFESCYRLLLSGCDHERFYQSMRGDFPDLGDEENLFDNFSAIPRDALQPLIACLAHLLVQDPTSKEKHSYLDPILEKYVVNYPDAMSLSDADALLDVLAPLAKERIGLDYITKTVRNLAARLEFTRGNNLSNKRSGFAPYTEEGLRRLEDRLEKIVPGM